jgi:hypothetical protein
LIAVIGCSALADVPPTLHRRAILINYDPILEAYGSQRLHAVPGWWPGSGDPAWVDDLTSAYIADLESASHGLLALHLT